MEKRFRGVILGQIFTLNHPSSMDQEVGKKKKNYKLKVSAKKEEKRDGTSITPSIIIKS
jgi:hypothetical protein